MWSFASASYVLKASAFQLVQDNGLGSKRRSVHPFIKYCVFDHNYMLNFDPLLDKQIGNPHFSNQIIEIGSYTFQEFIYKGRETVKCIKHLYIGAKPYLDKFIVEKQSEIATKLEELKGNMRGEIRWLAYSEDFICSTADFDKYADDKLKYVFGKENTMSLEQIEEHILGIAN